jgi:hypothetical protein
LSGPSLDLIAPIRPLQLCADGGYQLRLGVLGVPLIMVPDNLKKTLIYVIIQYVKLRFPVLLYFFCDSPSCEIVVFNPGLVALSD